MEGNYGTVHVDLRRILAAMLGLQGLILLFIGIGQTGLSLPIIRPVVAVLYLTFVPGLLLSLVLGFDNHPLTTLLVYSVGLSLMLVMATGAVLSLLYPLAVAQPLSSIPLTVALTGVVLALTAGVRHRRVNVELRIPIGDLLEPLPLALLLLPFVSVFGTFLIDVYSTNIVLLWLLVLLSILPVAVAFRQDLESRWYALAVWVIALSLLYHGRSDPFVVTQPLPIITLEQGRWIPNFVGGGGSLLPNGVLFPAYAILADVPLPIEWGVINPFLVSFLPLTLFEAFRRQVRVLKAFIATCIFMFSFPFYTLYPGAGRVATPVLFLALLSLVISDEQLSRTSATTMGLMFAAGTGVSHYGTAYVSMFALLVAGGILWAIKTTDRIRGRNESLSVFGNRISLDGRTNVAQRSRVLTLPFLAFYTMFASAWYLYTANGVKFAILPRKIIDAIQGVLYTELSGGAANAATKAYGSQAIAISRYIYILIGALMTVGIALAILGRVSRQQKLVDDEYLAVAGGFLSMLGGSALPSGSGFAVARVMMIVFTFTAPFALLGLGEVIKPLRAVYERFDLLNRSRAPISDRGVSVMFALILSVFLLLNTGVVSEVVTHDYAPRNAVSNERLLNSENPLLRSKVTDCIECNVQTHAWMITHSDRNATVYGDRLTWAQVDFYNGLIQSEIETGYTPSKGFYKPLWSTRNGTNESAYLVLLPHNMDTNSLAVQSRYDWRSMDELAPVIRQSEVVYDSEDSIVYRTTGNESDNK